MKIITYKDNNTIKAGVLDKEGVIDAEACAKAAGLKGNYNSVRAILSNPEGLECLKKAIEETRSKAETNYKDINRLELLAPVMDPEKILGAALNYYDACEKSKIPVPTVLQAFGKYPNSINVPDGKVDLAGHTVTWEGELGVVIGKNCKNVTAGDALLYVAGYTVVNDFSAMDYAQVDVQLLRGKAHDGFLPMGPVLVTADELGDPGNLHITTTLNGDIVQDSNTRGLIVDVPHLIEYFSSFMTLVPGDIIATGTPAGTARHFDPPRFLLPGDVVEVTIEKIGSLKNIC